MLSQSLAKKGYALKRKEPPVEADMLFAEGQYTLSFQTGSPAAGQTWELCMHPRVHTPTSTPQAEDEKPLVENMVTQMSSSKTVKEVKAAPVAPKEITIVIDGEEPKAKRRKASLYTSRDILSTTSSSSSSSTDSSSEAD